MLEERAEQLQINIIKKVGSETVIEQQQKLSHKQSATDRSNKIKELITDAYIKKVKEDETISNSEFTNDYLPRLQQLIDRIFPGTKIPYNAKTIAKMVGSIKKQGFIKKDATWRRGKNR